MTLVTDFSSESESWFKLDGLDYSTQNGNESYSLALNDDTFRFEVRADDFWKYGSKTSERSEIRGETVYAPGEVLDVSYSFMIEPGATNTATGRAGDGSWLILGQFHADDWESQPPFAIEMLKEKMAIVVRYGDPADHEYRELYVDTKDIERGRYYEMDIEVRFENNGNGFLNVWRDGEKIVSYSGPIGYDNGVYWKYGVYRSEADTNIAVDYRDISVRNGGAPVVFGDDSANTLLGTSEEDQIYGRGGNDTLSGLEGDDHLFGEAGNDRLIGGAGADRLEGGLNNDTYVLSGNDRSQDVIVENAGEGTDTVEIDQNYSLGANLENLTLTGVDHISGVGNDANNVITGYSGNNILDGGAGADTLAGGFGNDYYIIDNTGDRATEAAGAGIDEIRTTLTSFDLSTNGHGNIDNLMYVGTGAFSGSGNSLANIITGGSGADVLDGRGGADVLIGQLGNDVYVVNLAGDQVVEADGGGYDTINSSVTFTLGSNVEALVLTGTGSISGVGNDLNNSLVGNNGANQLDGGEGADAMAGGSGNDTYTVDNIGDSVSEDVGAGTDTIRTSLLAFDLGAPGVGNVEHLTFVGIGDFVGHGNALANTLTGSAGNDELSGAEGADTLWGNEGADVLDGELGNDTVVGAGGNDVLAGGAGKDTLTGGSGYDNFVFNAALSSTTNIDRITDFNVLQDTIRLENAVMPSLGSVGTLSSASFWKSTTGLAHDSNDRIIYETDTGKVIYDSNGSAAGGSVQIATLNPNLALTNADFVVI